MSAVRQAFRDQAQACASLGSPLMERLMNGLVDRLQTGTPVADRVLGWTGDPSSRADSVPLRLAGGLHALVLTGRDADLAAAYSTTEADPTPAALAAIRAHPAFLLDWLASPPQTNEVRRSTPLIAAAHWLTARFGLPLILCELGASAGLNLLWDHYALRIGDETFGPAHSALTLTPDWTGPLPPLAPPTILDRRGADLNPLDPMTDRLRLLAYLWPDQPDRIARTRAALDLAAHQRLGIDRADAADWLEARLATPTSGALHLVFHTVAGPEGQGEGRSGAGGPPCDPNLRRIAPRLPHCRLAVLPDQDASPRPCCDGACRKNQPHRPPVDGSRRHQPRSGPHPDPLARR